MPGDKDKCFWDSRGHLQWEGCGLQALELENLQREGNRRGIPVMGRSSFRAHSHINGLCYAHLHA